MCFLFYKKPTIKSETGSVAIYYGKWYVRYSAFCLKIVEAKGEWL